MNSFQSPFLLSLIICLECDLILQAIVVPIGMMMYGAQDARRMIQQFEVSAVVFRV